MRYRETIWSDLFPGNRHTIQCLQPAVLAAENALELTPAQRRRTVWRLDGGAGSDEQLGESMITGRQNDFGEHPLGFDVIRVVREGSFLGIVAEREEQAIAAAEALRASATWQNTIGAVELATVWTDPNFDASERAFYYARVIEIPTPRWTAYEAKRYGVELPEKVPMITQERAYTSPIWYTPE